MWGITWGVFLMGLPMLAGAAAFDCASSIATAGLCLAYALPIAFRLVFAHDTFEPGPFTLGRYGKWPCSYPSVLFCMHRSFHSACNNWDDGVSACDCPLPVALQ